MPYPEHQPEIILGAMPHYLSKHGPSKPQYVRVHQSAVYIRYFPFTSSSQLSIESGSSFATNKVQVIYNGPFHGFLTSCLGANAAKITYKGKSSTLNNLRAIDVLKSL